MEALLIPHNTIIPSDILSFLENQNNVINKLSSGGKNVIIISDTLNIYRINDRQQYLLFKTEKQDNIVLHIFRTCLNYDDYKKFRGIEDINIQLNYCKSETEDDEIKAKFAELKPSVLVKKTLPDSMWEFESEKDFSNKTQSYVFEMEDWIRSTKKITSKHHQIYETLQTIVINHQYKGVKNSNGWFYMDIKDTTDLKIIFKFKENSANTLFYLFKVTNDIDKCISEINDENTNNADYLLKLALKGYPDWILYDDFENWEKIEYDQEANLALSEEEVWALNTSRYPFFINGLAGSGKSTILYYLFANALAFDEKHEKKLIFLTYSKDLTEQTKRIVKSLFKSNPYINKGKKIKFIESNFDNCFQSFQDFLKSYLNDEEKNKFSKKNYTSYYRFQQNYHRECNLPIKKNDYSAAKVWSVIRTFIKGRKSNEYLTTDEYNKIERKDRTVTIEDYKIIKEEIFDKWYIRYWDETSLDNPWDDLDLVRYILNKKQIKPEYDIIFCDEAQDFTIVENRLILSMSKYSKYDLSDFKQIPIAYAGDPTQTVSPTGFNLSRLKDVFNYSFAEQIGNNISLNIQILYNNYRSKKAIVQFANTLQYIRKCFLSDDFLKPQCLWNPIGDVSPLFYNEDNIEDALIVKALNKAASIINGDDDEDQYKNSNNKKDEKLKKISNQGKIRTAITAKGLETDTVVLYRFADNMPKSFSKIFKNQQLENDSERFDCLHFLTKLYIAVSRAKKILYIIDTELNKKKLWDYFINNEFVQNTLLPTRPKDMEIWGKEDYNGDFPIGGIKPGMKDDFVQILTDNYNPREIAESIRYKAKINEDAQEMKRAAGYFEEDSDTDSKFLACECMAYHYLYNLQYEKAGDEFSKIDYKQESANAYWEGKCWNKLTQCDDKVKKTWALYYKGEKTLIELVKDKNLDLVHDLAPRFDILSDAYNDIAIQIGKDVEKFDNKNFLYRLKEFISELSKKGFKFLDEERALLCYKNGEYANAIEIWDSITDMKFSNEYYQAQVHEAKNHNDKIYWMNKGGKRTDLLNKYSDLSAIDTYNLNDQSKRIIFIQLTKEKDRFDYTLNYPYNGKDKYDLLYETNPLQLIDKYVLDDYNESKFEQYLESKIKKSEESIFDKPLTTDFFEKIFNLEKGRKKTIWIDFLKLRDMNKKRVLLKNKENVKLIFDVLVEKIRKNNNIYLASCFMEMLFDIDYSYERAYPYYRIILNIFDGKNYFFSKRDLDISSTRNVYFTQCGFDKNQLNNIKGNLCDFVTKVLNDDELRINLSETKALFRIIEKITNFNYTNDIYRLGLANEKFSALYEYFDIRIAVNMLYSDIDNSLFDFLNQLEYNDISLKTAIDTFDQDDSVAFIRKAVANKKSLSSDQILIIGELLYKNKYLNEKDIKSKQQEDEIIIILDQLITKEIKIQYDIYKLKVLFFAFEKLYSDKNEVIAKKYDDFINNYTSDYNQEIIQYFKERALLHWKRFDTKIAKTKKQEYNYKGKIDNIRSYPTINRLSQYNAFKTIENDCKIDGISIQLQVNRKTIWFSDGTNDILEIRKGVIEISDKNKAKQDGQHQVTIDESFLIEIESGGDCINITSGGKKYQIRFNN